MKTSAQSGKSNESDRYKNLDQFPNYKTCTTLSSNKFAQPKIDTHNLDNATGQQINTLSLDLSKTKTTKKEEKHVIVT